MSEIKLELLGLKTEVGSEPWEYHQMPGLLGEAAV